MVSVRVRNVARLRQPTSVSDYERSVAANASCVICSLVALRPHTEGTSPMVSVRVRNALPLRDWLGDAIISGGNQWVPTPNSILLNVARAQAMGNISARACPHAMLVGRRTGYTATSTTGDAASSPVLLPSAVQKAGMPPTGTNERLLVTRVVRRTRLTADPAACAPPKRLSVALGLVTGDTDAGRNRHVRHACRRYEMPRSPGGIGGNCGRPKMAFVRCATKIFRVNQRWSSWIT